MEGTRETLLEHIDDVITCSKLKKQLGESCLENLQAALDNEKQVELLLFVISKNDSFRKPSC